jgi:hypothetical protein
MKTLLLFVAAATVAAEVAAPRPGVVLATDGSVREVRGAAGSFVLGEPDFTDARRVASSGSVTVVKLADSVRVSPEVAFDAPAGDALFGFSRDGRLPFAYFPLAGTFARISADRFDALPVDTALLAGDVVALAGAEDVLEIYVRREDGLHALRVRLSDGAVEADSALGADARICVAMPGGRIVYATGSRIVVREAAGGEHPVETGAPVSSLALMGGDWIHARSGAQSIALRITADGVTPFYLPEVSQ